MTNVTAAITALGDPTRQAIFERLVAGPRPVGQLAEGLPVSRPAVSQHLKVLKDAGLVLDRKVGTRRLYQVDPQAIADLRAYFDAFWDQVTGRLSRCGRTRGATGMIDQGAGVAVRQSVVVQAPPERAFEVFTAAMSTWWPLATHSIGSKPVTDAVIEPRVGGRWFERSADGSECDWGRVQVWEPPDRVVLVWQLAADFGYDPALHTEVEVRFRSEDGERTWVELEHRGIEAYGERAEEMRDTFGADDGWGGLLRRYAEGGF